MLFFRYVVAVEVIDKRHTDGKSAPMEVVGTLRALVKTRGRLDVEIKEIVTDQNKALVKLFALAKSDPEAFVTATKALLANFEDAADRSYHVMLCQLCHDMFHSLDLWHRTKNTGKAMMKVCSNCFIGKTT